jgi:hypothetical protein
MSIQAAVAKAMYMKRGDIHALAVAVKMLGIFGKGV